MRPAAAAKPNWAHGRTWVWRQAVPGITVFWIRRVQPATTLAATATVEVRAASSTTFDNATVSATLTVGSETEPDVVVLWEPQAGDMLWMPMPEVHVLWMVEPGDMIWTLQKNDYQWTPQ